MVLSVTRSISGCSSVVLVYSVTRLSETAHHLDVVVAQKMAHGKTDCEADGWRLRVWAADIYGALHPATFPLVIKVSNLLCRGNTTPFWLEGCDVHCRRL